MEKLRVLNLFAGLGGNRKLWDGNIEVTAVEINPQIAKVYADYFPNDTLVVDDAHKYLLEHFSEFDFICSSPPCITHTRLNVANYSKGAKPYEYPDMKLYQEIIFLDSFFRGKYVVENVIPYYAPLIAGHKLDRHIFWSNFSLRGISVQSEKVTHVKSNIGYLENFFGFDLSGYEIPNKRQILRNCVLPEIGFSVLERAINSINESGVKQIGLFNQETN